MNRLFFLLLALISVPCFAGGSFGGNPPAVMDSVETVMVSPVDFKSVAFDAINNPDKEFSLNGKLVKPKLIDIKAKIMRFETESKELIDIKQTE